jgi:Zn-dependent peptidase ImmA (M78 family)
LRIGFIDFKQAYNLDGILGATYVKNRLICADKSLLDERAEGRLNFTFAHEAGHWVLHRKLAETPAVPVAGNPTILCRKKDAKKPIEWQADYFAACLLMPEKWIKLAFEKSVGCDPLKLHNEKGTLTSPFYIEPCVGNWPFIAGAVRKAGNFLNVSKQAVMIRLQELDLVINETAAAIGWDNRHFAT